MPLIVASAASAILNFECINLQNYNICRYKKAEKVLKRREEKNSERRKHEYGDAELVIAKKIVDNDKKLPSIDEIIAGIETNEQLLQMLKFFREEMSRRGNAMDIQKQKVKIGGNENGNIA